MLTQYEQTYGIGSKLFAQMGWNVGQGASPIIPEQRPNRVGLGYGAADVPLHLAINDGTPLPQLPSNAPFKSDLLSLCAKVSVNLSIRSGAAIYLSLSHRTGARQTTGIQHSTNG